MKNYLVFYYYGYYPVGGMEDYIFHAETLDELVKFFENIDDNIRLSLESGLAYIQVADMVIMRFKEFDEIPTRAQLEDISTYKNVTSQIEED